MEGLRKTIAITIILAIIVGFVFLVLNPKRPTAIVISTGTVKPPGKFGIFGAVQSPGYYEYEGELRIGDAAEMAGGLTNNADPAAANLGKWIDDGETLIIPTIAETMPTITPIAADTQKVDLNSATKEELMSLPGIGEKRASDIIKLREEKGGFTSVDELLEINGISIKLLEGLYDRIIIQ